ncbi:hypothetical protein RZ76_13620 [Apilactobacillus kunkeei]|uniref:DUF805 domain-containing protein n=1 Tax=Apilactobacillus kunkeei TaxID=148814 RepID=UPI0006DB3046|nr:DUF805 domain-containing protein [Apilactobacillus kunkeei]KPN83297.1 hypothetical protein RZ76_13620 [Apilactobacillus kunkeei]
MNKKFCSNCGAELSVADSFCSNCGTKQSYSESYSSNSVDEESTKMIRFTDAITKCLKKTFDLNGVATRAEYWWFFLLRRIVLFGSLCINTYVCIHYRPMFAFSEIRPIALFAIPVILGFVSITITVATLSVSVRRLHDTNSSGHFMWLSFVPLFGIIALLIIFCQKSVVTGNKYRNVSINNGTNIWIILLYVIYSILAALIYFGMYVGQMYLMFYA